jgi:hypothetical protein
VFAFAHKKNPPGHQWNCGNAWGEDAHRLHLGCWQPSANMNNSQAVASSGKDSSIFISISHPPLRFLGKFFEPAVGQPQPVAISYKCTFNIIQLFNFTSFIFIHFYSALS